MKKTRIILSGILSAVFALSCLTGCKSNELFAESTLEEYEIPWLQKPDGVVNEVQYFDTNYYAYEAEISSEEAYLAYCQNVLDRFLLDAYNVGHFVSAGGDGNPWDFIPYNVISPSDNLEDYLRQLSDEYNALCMIYYTASPLNGYDELHGGYRLEGLKHLTIWYVRQPNENGLHDLRITLAYGHDVNYYRIPENSNETAG